MTSIKSKVMGTLVFSMRYRIPIIFNGTLIEKA